MNNKYINALLKTFLFFAVAHVIILTFLVIIRLDHTYLNIFYISGVSEIFPDTDKGTLSTILSSIIILLVYIYYYKSKRNK